jgi:hypothetical protein
MDPHASIQKLTETFVTELQEDFPATVSTVFRTGDKLSMGSSTAEDECCVLCQVCGIQLTVPCRPHISVCRFAGKYLYMCYTNTIK